MPALRIYSPGYNFLTAQPLRRRTSDGEVSWDQPGPMFDPDEDVGTRRIQRPRLALRTPIGHLVACPNDPAYAAATLPANFCAGKPAGSLVVYNPGGSDGHPAERDGRGDAGLRRRAAPSMKHGEPIDRARDAGQRGGFLPDRRPTSQGVPAPLRPYIGRPGAEVLGKALFWDMQVGQRRRPGLRLVPLPRRGRQPDQGPAQPQHHGPAGKHATLSQVKPRPTRMWWPRDFPFHKGDARTTCIGDDDANDVMSSMGVSRFKQFVDIPAIGIANFLPAVQRGQGAAAGYRHRRCPTRFRSTRASAGWSPATRRPCTAAAFNFDNFWDGRARFHFNGGSVFGPSDPTAHIFIDPGAGDTVAGRDQAAISGPICSWRSRKSPNSRSGSSSPAWLPSRWGRRSATSRCPSPAATGPRSARSCSRASGPVQRGAVRTATPLANQLVATDDSRLGPFSNQGGSACTALGRPTQPASPDSASPTRT